MSAYQTIAHVKCNMTINVPGSIQDSLHGFIIVLDFTIKTLRGMHWTCLLLMWSQKKLFSYLIQRCLKEYSTSSYFRGIQLQM